MVGNKNYLVAEQPLEAGKFIHPRAISWKEVDMGQLEARGIAVDHLVPQSKENEEMLGGVVPRNNVQPGHFIAESEILSPTDPDFLPTVLDDGMRAVSIAVNDVTGGAGLFRPGNLVDVILTVAGDKHRKKTDALSRTLLQGVRILAVNRDVGLDYKEAAKNDDAKRRDKTVTLEVQPKAAEVLALAGTLGELSLSLCSNGMDGDKVVDAGMTKSNEIVVHRQKEASGKEVQTIFGSASKTIITN